MEMGRRRRLAASRGEVEPQTSSSRTHTQDGSRTSPWLEEGAGPRRDRLGKPHDPEPDGVGAARTQPGEGKPFHHRRCQRVCGGVESLWGLCPQCSSRRCPQIPPPSHPHHSIPRMWGWGPWASRAMLTAQGHTREAPPHRSHSLRRSAQRLWLRMSCRNNLRRSEQKRKHISKAYTHTESQAQNWGRVRHQWPFPWWWGLHTAGGHQLPATSSSQEAPI